VDVHEYQAKELLATFGVPVPKGAVAFSPDQAVYAATELGGWNWAVKAQIHAGARGKAGGIKICKTYHEVRDAAQALLGKRLVTIQTGPEGKPVQRVYIEVAEPFDRELYLGYVLDRKAEPDRAAPVVHDERQIRQVELFHEPRDRLDVAVVRVPPDLCGFVRAAESDQIRRDFAPRQLRDDLPPQKGRGRLAVQQQDGLALPFVDVMHPLLVEVEPVRGEALDRPILR